MSADSAQKRFSAMNISAPWRGLMVVPTGTVGEGQRAAAMFLYSGVAVVAAAVAETKGRRPQQLFTIARPSGIDLLVPLFPIQVVAFVPAPIDVHAEVGLEAVHVFVVPRILTARTDAHAVSHGWRVLTITGTAEARTNAGAHAAPYPDSEVLQAMLAQQRAILQRLEHGDEAALALLGVTL